MSEPSRESDNPSPDAPTEPSREALRAARDLWIKLVGAWPDDQAPIALALDRFRAAGVREALEEAAALCENHAERRVKGIILAPELAGEFPDDGDELAPMLPDNGAVAAVANDLAKVRLHIAAAGIRSLKPHD